MRHGGMEIFASLLQIHIFEGLNLSFLSEGGSKGK